MPEMIFIDPNDRKQFEDVLSAVSRAVHESEEHVSRVDIVTLTMKISGAYEMRKHIADMEAAIREHVKWEGQASCEHSETSCDECDYEPKEGETRPPCCVAWQRLRALVEPKEASHA